VTRDTNHYFFFIFAKNYLTMDLSKILSLAGRNGLFKVVSQAKNAVIVESLIDGKRFPAFGHDKISSLEEISVFTTGEDIALKDVFKAFYVKLEGKPAIDSKSDNISLKKFFLEMVSDYDQDRVYISDIKKMVSWYNMLLQQNLLDFSEKEGEEIPGKTNAGEQPADKEDSIEPVDAVDPG
jgi:hypothetical protein